MKKAIVLWILVALSASIAVLWPLSALWVFNLSLPNTGVYIARGYLGVVLPMAGARWSEFEFSIRYVGMSVENRFGFGWPQSLPDKELGARFLEVPLCLLFIVILLPLMINIYRRITSKRVLVVRDILDLLLITWGVLLTIGNFYLTTWLGSDLTWFRLLTLESLFIFGISVAAYLKLSSARLLICALIIGSTLVYGNMYYITVSLGLGATFAESMFFIVNSGVLWGLLSFVPVWFIRKYYRERMGRGALRPCNTCGYDLTGNISGVCPECGQEIGSYEGHR